MYNSRLHNSIWYLQLFNQYYPFSFFRMCSATHNSTFKSPPCMDEGGGIREENKLQTYIVDGLNVCWMALSRD